MWRAGLQVAAAHMEGGGRRTDAFKEQVTGSTREGRETDRRFLGCAADRVIVSDR